MRWLPLAALVAIPAAAWVAASLQPPPTLTGVELGRHVYVSEGCMHCHSQFIRPGSADEELWGQARDPDFSRNQAPALIGNRRQGPDLMNVGSRRIRDWQRMHLRNPRLVSPHSRMPSYEHLFQPGDPRGEALLDYLDSLGHEGEPKSPDSSFAPNTAPSDTSGSQAHEDPGR